MKTVSVRVDVDVLDRARKHCEKSGIVLSWYISNALKKQLDKESKSGSK